MPSVYAGVVVHRLLRRVPRLQMLAVFESAARLGSFTAAAEELGMTQPAVSRQIAGLERSAGLILFDRTGNRAFLNDRGRELLAAVQDAFGRVDGSIEKMEADESGFRLAANPGFAQQWLLPHFDSLQAAVGDNELRLRLFDRDSELSEETFDAAIHLTEIRAAPMGSRILFEERVIPVAAAGFASDHALGTTSRAADLVDVTKLHLDGRHRRWATWQDWFEGHGVVWSQKRARLSYNNYAVVVADALNGTGVALAWRGLIERHLRSGALVQVGPELHRPEMAYLLVPGGTVEEDVVDRLVDWLGETLG